jgi:SIR2-like domain
MANVTVPDHSESGDHRFASIESTADFLAGEITRTSITLLCGAGISLCSGLPLAKDLAKALLKPFINDSAEIENILSPQFPFEALVENFDRYLPVAGLLRLFSLGAPSTVHFLIGKLFTTGLMKVGFTTNFDLLIERGYALSAADSSQTLRTLATEREIKGFGRLLAPACGPTLVKLHGSIDRPRTIKATLSRVARRDPGRILAPTLKYLFSTGEHSTILIVGYSCLDQFDINPCIPASGPKSKTIVHVSHPRGQNAVGYFETRSLSGCLAGYRGQTVICDATLLLARVWERLAARLGPVVMTPPTTLDWHSFIHNWRAREVPTWASLGAQSTAASIEMAIAELLAERVSPGRGLETFRKVASWAKKNCDDLLESLASMKIAECQMINNKSPLRARSFAERAIAILESKAQRRTGRSRRRAKILGSAHYYLAAALRRMGRIKAAIRHSKQGLRWYRGAKYRRDWRSRQSHWPSATKN